MSQLHLQSLQLGLPAISPIFGAFLAEATQVCLQAWGHKPGVRMQLGGNLEENVEIWWEGFISEQQARTWHDQQEATEYGATGIAVMMILHYTPYTVVKRSVKGTGFDYWLGDAKGELPFQESARLEISGIFCGDEPLIRRRVNKKLKQIQKSENTGLPALVIVAEFSKPAAHFVQL